MLGLLIGFSFWTEYVRACLLPGTSADALRARLRHDFRLRISF
jgi:hypothetical protein